MKPSLLRPGRVLLSMVVSVVLALAACALEGRDGGVVELDMAERETTASSHGPAWLTARPNASSGGDTGGGSATGLQPLTLGRSKESYLFVPPTYRDTRPAPLLLLLHGAGGNGGRAVGPLRDFAQAHGVVLLAPTSLESSWDLMRGGFGPDVRFIDEALGYVFDRYAIDPDRVAVQGFSDGATYALSLGLSNGDLFTAVVALSPGYVSADPTRSRPRIFIAHGVNDEVLPFESTNGQIVPRLREASYDVTFRRHAEGHTAMPRLEEASKWLASGW